MNSLVEIYLPQLDRVEEILGVKFKDKSMLLKALIHDSFLHEKHDIKRSNERLEFLGDAVLGLAINHLLFEMYPHWREGDMTSFKSQLVSADTLAEIGKGINLGEYILLGKGEESRGGRHRSSIIADCMEAVIGAIYLDQGFEVAFDFIKRLYGNMLKTDAPPKDYKSHLQEISQKWYHTLPTYKLIQESGPPHEKTFYVRVNIGKTYEGEGEGSSKKEAEQVAAKNLLEKLQEKGCEPQGGEEEKPALEEETPQDGSMTY